jgi:hypothetical protein
MVTLIGFLLFTTSFLVLVSIESPIPQASPNEVQEQLKEKPLQLTLTLREKDVELWSPFSKISPKAIANNPDGQLDLKAIHEALLEIKKQFPQETSIVLVPRVGTLYDHLISLMDALRTIEGTDPPLYGKNEKTGIDEPIKALFPKIIFGNLMTDEES